MGLPKFVKKNTSFFTLVKDPRQHPKMPDPKFFVRIKNFLGHFIAFLSGFCLRPTAGAFLSAHGIRHRKKSLKILIFFNFSLQTSKFGS
jgi:hypothetical protein